MNGEIPSTSTPWPEGKVSYQEYLARSGDEWSEWVDGEVFMMTPVGHVHQALLGFLSSLLTHFTEHHSCGQVLTEPFSMKTGPDLPGRSPDILFLAAGHRDRLRTNHLAGPADLVVEILSPESVTRDRKVKFAEYETGGVREYWLIDPLNRLADFHHLSPDGQYEPIPIGTDGVFHSRVLKGLWLQVEWLWPDQRPRLLEVLRRWGMIA